MQYYTSDTVASGAPSGSSACMQLIVNSDILTIIICAVILS